MKGLIIENEWDADISIKAFLNDNPKLFSTVKEQLHSIHMEPRSMLPLILESDAIIVASTWMYKNQLDDYLNAFLNPKFPKKIKFFIHAFVDKLNDWGNYKETWAREEQLFNKIKRILTKGHTIYDFFEDHCTSRKQITDELNYFRKKEKRHRYGYFELKYDKKSNLFYSNHKWYTLEKIKEDFKIS